MPSFRPTGSAAKFLARVGTVSGFTMLSRATGFVRDVVLAWLIGAGPIADAFFIALRIPNHFRALFAEGAFNAAFVPTYAGTLERDGAEKALEFAARVLGALLAVQVVILIAAELWARGLLVLITPGFEKDPVLGDLTVTLTRITFPYLLCVTLVTVYGAVSAMYYADRLYQLPIGVIAIAIGTVLLPELSRRFAAGDDVGARRAQKRAVFWSVVLTAPFVVAFLAIPDLLVKIAFARGAFDEAAAMRAAATLRAYGVGLLAIVLLRSVVPGFHARGDTRTPMWIAFVGIGVNVALKFWLSDQYDVSGLALATSAGAWVNLIALVIIDRRRAAAGGA